MSTEELKTVMYNKVNDKSLLTPFLLWTLDVAMGFETMGRASQLPNQILSPDYLFRLFQKWKWLSEQVAQVPYLKPGARYEPGGQFLPMPHEVYLDVVHTFELLEKEFSPL